MTSYVTNWSSCVSYPPSCCCVWYYMAKQCFLVTIPNEKLGSLKTPLGSLSRLLFLKYPLCHPLFLSHSPPSLMCFDHHFDCSCHLRISKTISLSRQSLDPHNSSSNWPLCLTILQSTKRRFRPHFRRPGSGYPTPSVWSPNLIIFFLHVFLFLTYLVLT